MSNWGAPTVNKSWRDTTKTISLCDSIAGFPSSLKQAMFAAASTRVINRGTWDGCAFNAAGMEVGKSDSVSSISVAAKTFGVTDAAVSQFIRLWDDMPGTDEHCTEVLRTCIEKAGLFVEPGQRLPRILKVKVYEDQQKVLRKQFDDLMDANMIMGTDVAEKLLASIC